MQVSENVKNKLRLIFKVFFIGLLLQFVLQTFVSFQLGRTGSIWTLVWAWKEIIILGLIVFLVISLLKHHKMKEFLEHFPVKKFLWAFVITLAAVLIVSLLITKSGLGLTIMSIRYTFSGYLIFLIVFAVGRWFLDGKHSQLLERYAKIIKTLLVVGLLRWFVIWLAPRTVEFLGYNAHIFEGTVGENPPAAYYTQMNQGYVRNQFLFERPISRGFFLVAFWPLFFVYTIRNKGRKDMVYWGALYGLNIFSTFSRAAWGAWIVITFILLLMQYRKQFRKLALYVFLPILTFFVAIAYVGRDQIIAREYSNTGHKELVLEAVEKIKEKPIWGQGAGTAGPASHQSDLIKDYNPENQFLQVWIEYGLFGFIGRMVMFVRLLWLGIPAYRLANSKKASKQQKQEARILLACSLGLLGLAGEGLVLHSFIDRMIVYPFMAVFALAYVAYLKSNPRVVEEIEHPHGHHHHHKQQ